jgi:hypothetical protein
MTTSYIGSQAGLQLLILVPAAGSHKHQKRCMPEFIRIRLSIVETLRESEYEMVPTLDAGSISVRENQR